MGMDQYLLIPFLGEWTSIYQLFWCSPGVPGFDTLPHFCPVFPVFFGFPVTEDVRSDGLGRHGCEKDQGILPSIALPNIFFEALTKEQKTKHVQYHPVNHGVCYSEITIAMDYHPNMSNTAMEIHGFVLEDPI